MNPALKNLGFGPKDRVVMVHVDDLGMFPQSGQDFANLVEAGLVTSGSIMAPCPALEEAVDQALRHPEWDLGVHLTLTSEWDEYRWSPLATQDPQSGLLDDTGCFFQTREAVATHANADWAFAEMKLQVERLQATGIELTHLDNHMFSAFTPSLLNAYLKLGAIFDLPVFLPPISRIPHMWPQETAEILKSAVQDWIEKGHLSFDHQAILNLRHSISDWQAYAEQIFRGLPPGLSMVLLHPATDSPELRTIGPSWEARLKNYETLLNPDLLRYVQNLGVHLTTYRELQHGIEKH